jgi:LuxR family maltose regulon positive regulatory protein
MLGGITLFVLFGAIMGGAFIQVMAPILLALGGLLLYRLRLENVLPERFLGRFRPAAHEPPGAPVPAAPPAAPNQDALVEPLSARELEVLRLVDAGLTNAEIAARLVVATSTVKTHINNLYGKLGVQTRTQALKRARELGLLGEGQPQP